MWTLGDVMQRLILSNTTVIVVNHLTDSRHNKHNYKQCTMKYSNHGDVYKSQLRRGTYSSSWIALSFIAVQKAAQLILHLSSRLLRHVRHKSSLELPAQ